MNMKRKTCSQANTLKCSLYYRTNKVGFVYINSSTSSQIVCSPTTPSPALPPSFSDVTSYLWCFLSTQNTYWCKPRQTWVYFCSARKIFCTPFVTFALEGMRQSRYRPLNCWDAFPFRLITVGNPGFHLERSSLFYTEMEANWVFSHEG